MLQGRTQHIIGRFDFVREVRDNFLKKKKKCRLYWNLQDEEGLTRGRELGNIPSRGNGTRKGLMARGYLLLGQREPGMAGREGTQKKVGGVDHKKGHQPYLGVFCLFQE